MSSLQGFIRDTSVRGSLSIDRVTFLVFSPSLSLWGEEGDYNRVRVERMKNLTLKLLKDDLDPDFPQGTPKVSQTLKSASTLTLSAHLIPFSVFSRVLSDQFNIGLVFSEKLFQKTITAEFKETGLEDVLNVVSRQLNTDVVQVGNTFFVGKLRPEDRGIFVRKVIGYTNKELHETDNHRFPSMASWLLSVLVLLLLSINLPF